MLPALVWHQEVGPTVFATFDGDTDYFGSRTQQTMLNFRVSGARDILEIGCGTAQFAERMQRELGAQVLATDRSPERATAPNVTRPRASASTTPSSGQPAGSRERG